MPRLVVAEVRQNSQKVEAMSTARKMDSTVDRHVSLPVASRLVGKNRATVKAMALRGELTHEIVAGRVVITRESVEKYIAARDAAR